MQFTQKEGQPWCLRMCGRRQLGTCTYDVVMPRDLVSMIDHSDWHSFQLIILTVQGTNCISQVRKKREFFNVCDNNTLAHTVKHYHDFISQLSVIHSNRSFKCLQYVQFKQTCPSSHCYTMRRDFIISTGTCSGRPFLTTRGHRSGPTESGALLHAFQIEATGALSTQQLFCCTETLIF